MAGASEDDLIDNTANLVSQPIALTAAARPGAKAAKAAAAAVAAAAAAVAAAAVGAAGGPSRLGSANSQQQQQKIDAAAIAKLPGALEQLFKKKQSVCNMDAVRYVHTLGIWTYVYKEGVGVCDEEDSVQMQL